MDPATFGGFVGSAVAAFAATWAAFVRPMKRELAERPVKEEVEQSQRAPKERLSRLEEAVEAIRKDLDRCERGLDRLGSKMDTVATTDEFRAYSDHTTKAINHLAEKVGLVTGHIDALSRGRG